MAARIDIVAQATDKATAVLNQVSASLKKIKTEGAEVVAANRKIMTGWQKASHSAKGMTGNIGAMAMGFGKFAGVAGIAAFAVKGAVDALGHFGKKADQIKILEKSVKGFAGVMESAQKASAGMLSEAEIGKSMAMFQAFNLDMSKFAAATEAATKTSIRMGTDGGKAFEDLATAIARGSFKILDNLGVMMKQSDVTDRLRQKTGRLTGEFSAQERQSAMLELALEQLQEVNANVDPYDSTTGSIERMKTAFADLGNALLGEVAEGFASFLDFMSGFESQAEKMGAAGTKIFEGLKLAQQGETQAEFRNAEEMVFLRQKAAGFASAMVPNLIKLNEQEEANLITKEQQTAAWEKMAGLQKEFLNQQLDIFRATEETRAATSEAMGVESEDVRLQLEALDYQLAKQQGLTDAQIAQKQIQSQLAKAQKDLTSGVTKESIERRKIIRDLKEQLLWIGKIIKEEEPSKGRGGGSRRARLTDADRLKQEVSRRQIEHAQMLIRLRKQLDAIDLKKAQAGSQALQQQLKIEDKIDLLKAGKGARMTAEKRAAEIDLLKDESRLISIRLGLKFDELNLARKMADQKVADANADKAKEDALARQEELTERLAAAQEKLVGKMMEGVEAMRTSSAAMAEMSPEMAKALDGAAGMTEVWASYESGQLTVQQAVGGTVGVMGAAAASFIEDQKAKAVIMMLFEFAQAAAAFAGQNYVAGAAHLVAGGMFAAVAGGAGAGAPSASSAIAGGGQDPGPAVTGHSAASGGQSRTVIVQFGSGVVLGRPQDVAGAINDAQHSNRGTGRERRAY